MTPPNETAAPAKSLRNRGRTSALAAEAPPHPIVEFWRYFSTNRGPVIGLAVIATLVVVAVFADVLALYPPNEQFRDAFLAPPFWVEGGSTQFLLGTDDLGRDILSRIIFGARVFPSPSDSLSSPWRWPLGIALGLIAGFFRGVVETAIMRAMDVMLALPSLLLAIVIVAILGPSLINAAMAVVVVQLPHFVRLTRAAVITEMSSDYVTASRVSGAGAFRLMLITVLPNCMAPVIVQATLGFSTAVLDLAALGFLGMAPSRRRPSGARCWPTRCNSSSGRGGWSPSPVSRS